MPKLSQIREAIGLGQFYIDTSLPGGQVDSDDAKYRPITQRNRFDPPRITQERQQLVAVYLYQSNPFARRYIDILVAFTVGDQVSVLARDPAVQEVLDEFWNDPHNRWPGRVVDYARDLAIFGEYVLGINPLDGDEQAVLLQTQHISPAEVEQVILDPSDRYHVDKVKLKRATLQGIRDPNDPRLVIDVVKPRAFDGKRRLVGDGFFFRINNVGGSSRGLSDLFPLADWLQLYNDYQFNQIERLGHLTMYFFDVVLQNASERDIEDFKEKLFLDPPRPGSIIVHNERASLEPKQVNLGGGDMAAVGQSLFSTVVTGLGWPAHWTGSPGSAGRAVAEASNDPVFRHFLLRQSEYKRQLGLILKTQLDRAIILGRLDEGSLKSEDFKILFPRLALRDFQRAGGAAARIIQAIRDGADAGLIDPKTATALTRAAFEQIGMSLSDLGLSEGVVESLERAIDEVHESRRFPSERERELFTKDLMDLIIYRLAD